MKMISDLMALHVREVIPAEKALRARSPTRTSQETKCAIVTHNLSPVRQLNDMKSIFYSDSISLQSAEFVAYALFLLNVGTYDTHPLA